jgi:hypothetical protein
MNCRFFSSPKTHQQHINFDVFRSTHNKFNTFGRDVNATAGFRSGGLLSAMLHEKGNEAK